MGQVARKTCAWTAPAQHKAIKQFASTSKHFRIPGKPTKRGIRARCKQFASTSRHFKIHAVPHQRYAGEVLMYRIPATNNTCIQVADRFKVCGFDEVTAICCYFTETTSKTTMADVLEVTARCCYFGEVASLPATRARAMENFVST